MPPPSLRVLVPIGVIAVLVAGGWYVDSQRAKRRSALSGFFETQPVELSSRIGGRVAEIRVREGDTVRSGQTLLLFEALPNRADTESKQALAEQAREQLREVTNGPRPEEIHRQEEVVAELRAALLKLRNGPLPEEIRAARDRLRQAEANRRKVVAGPRPQEIAAVQAAERNAAAKLAQAERGLTSEERAQAKARLEAATASETLAREEMARYQCLFDEGAVSRQQLDRVTADLQSAAARTRELAEAFRRAELGTPAEELAEAREAHNQARAALDLSLAGSRAEDKEAAAAEVAAARESLNLLTRGTRAEDLRAAEARLAQAQATLLELRHGSREEQIGQAKAAARAAALTARGSAENLAERVLRAPRDGQIERILVATGDLLSPGTPAIRMADPADLWLRVYIPESRIAKVRLNDPVELRIDGIAGAVRGIVESISTRGEFTPANLQTPEERGKQVFGVRIRLAQPDSRVKAGMFATVRGIAGVP